MAHAQHMLKLPHQSSSSPESSESEGSLSAGLMVVGRLTFSVKSHRRQSVAFSSVSKSSSTSPLLCRSSGWPSLIIARIAAADAANQFSMLFPCSRQSHANKAEGLW